MCKELAKKYSGERGRVASIKALIRDCSDASLLLKFQYLLQCAYAEGCRVGKSSC